MSRRHYKLVEDYTYGWTHRGTPYRILVPAGFIYDGASVPRPLWSVFGLRPDGLIRSAALVHDWIYRFAGELPEGCFQRHVDGVWRDVERGWLRYDTDRLFGRMMRETGLSQFRRRAAFLAVHWFGRRSWGSMQKMIDGHCIDLAALQTLRRQKPDAVRDPVYGLVRPIVFAHRGGVKEAPESTRLAFDHAIRCGVDVLELDLDLTRDGRIVVWHGPHLDQVNLPGVGRLIEERKARGLRSIWQWDWEDLKAATVDWPDEVDLWEPDDVGVDRETSRRLMSLDEFFDFLGELEDRHSLDRPIPANIELKGRRGGTYDRSRFLSGDHMRRFVELLDRKAGDRTVVVVAVDRRTVVGFERELRRPRRSSDRIYPTNVTITEQLQYLDRLKPTRKLSWLTGLAPILRLLRRGRRLTGKAFQTTYEVATPALGKEIHRQGGALHTFLTGFTGASKLVSGRTTDGEIKQALIGQIDAGVDGVMTDHPRRVAGLIEEIFGEDR